MGYFKNEKLFFPFIMLRDVQEGEMKEMLKKIKPSGTLNKATSK